MIDPMLRGQVWSPAFWWRIFLLGERWCKCERCGFTSECLSYGDTVRANRKALELDGMPQPSEIRGPEEKKVCMTCCDGMRQAHGDEVMIKLMRVPNRTCQAMEDHRPTHAAEVVCNRDGLEWFSCRKHAPKSVEVVALHDWFVRHGLLDEDAPNG